MATKNNHVAEIQGLYGPFTMAERVVQKIWLQGDFNRKALRLTDGRSLQVRTTGRWNLLGGPDFQSARLVIDSVEITGDVEVHFRASDWRAHGHEADAAYDRVRLHVVLFPPGEGERPALDHAQKEIPTLVLLPWLHRDLEEYASDDALEGLTARDEWRPVAELAIHSPAEIRALLAAKAESRWRQKVHFARIRIAKLGWPDALHHAALEILGYRQNRPAMLAVAGRYSLDRWNGPLDLAAVFEENRAHWRLQGVRPANHPLRRLRQYHRWVIANRDWPNHVVRLFPSVAPAEGSDPTTRRVRRSLALAQLRRSIAGEVTGGALSGSRLDNLVCDGLLPLVATCGEGDYFSLWFHWFVGDVPDQIRRAMPKLGLVDGQLQPFCHGYARGLLAWFLESEARASG